MAKPRLERIYLDHAATTPLASEAREAMLPWLLEGYGNPSSLHADGRKAKNAIDSAREAVSGALGSLFAEVLFTSGGTEAANLAIVGLALNHVGSKRNRILIGAAEHHCVLGSQATLEALGYRVDFIPVDRQARLDRSALQEALKEDVLLVSCMHANNELGTVNPISAIADQVHSVGALLHTDAVQTFLAPGQTWSVKELDADLITASSHKIYGPKGAGAIYIRAGVILKPLISGGGQEREMRGGTENVAAIAGFGAAVKLATQQTVPERNPRDVFVEEVTPLGAVLTTPNFEGVLPYHAHLRFPGIDAETILIVLDRLGISASSGAACSSGSVEPSHVLLAAGFSAEEARQGLRFSFGRGSTVKQAIEAADRVRLALEQIRGASRSVLPLS